MVGKGRRQTEGRRRRQIGGRQRQQIGGRRKVQTAVGRVKGQTAAPGNWWQRMGRAEG
jgi:hypothetical protein